MLSIVIPMYNSENVIQRTIKSVIEQKLDDYEIIIIDDCSTDNSYKICNEYILKNNIKNVKIIKNDINHGGPSYSRNKGIEIAKGEYIIFLDSDDYYEKDTINKMLEQMKQQSLIITGIRYKYKNKEKLLFYKPENNILNVPKNEIVQIYLKGLLNQPSNKMYDLNFIRDKGILFNEQSAYGEDLEFNLEYIKNIQNIILINEPLYIYSETKTGLNNTYKKNELIIDKNNFINKINIFSEYFSLTKEEEKELYTKYVISRIRLYYRLRKYDKRQDKKQYLLETIKDDNINHLLDKTKFKNTQKIIIKVLLRMKLLFILRVYLKLIEK